MESDRHYHYPISKPWPRACGSVNSKSQAFLLYLASTCNLRNIVAFSHSAYSERLALGLSFANTISAGVGLTERNNIFSQIKVDHGFLYECTSTVRY
jgi:hypothetical protein